MVSGTGLPTGARHTLPLARRGCDDFLGEVLPCLSKGEVLLDALRLIQQVVEPSNCETPKRQVYC